MQNKPSYDNPERPNAALVPHDGLRRKVCAKRVKPIWTSLVLGVVGSVAVVSVSSSTPRIRPTDSFAGPNRDDGVLGQPRILTVLTTYDKRSALMKGYKEAALNRQDGVHPAIFLASNLEDEDPHGVVDFKVGARRPHRSLAAIAEATRRHAGTFDWIALGDDDTAFMYNRATNFLRNIDYKKPVIFGRVDGLNYKGRPEKLFTCFSREATRTPADQLVAHGCCQDFTNPCKVPVFPPEIDFERKDALSDYGPNGLYWPYGGSGAFISAGLAVDVVGAEGWALCARMFVNMNTDIQIAQCLKMHGYSIGAYPKGFSEIRTPTSDAILRYLANHCEILGVHLGIKHLENNVQYTPETFEAAVAAVRDADILSGRDGEDVTSSCHESFGFFP